MFRKGILPGGTFCIGNDELLLLSETNQAKWHPALAEVTLQVSRDYSGSYPRIDLAVRKNPPRL